MDKPFTSPSSPPLRQGAVPPAAVNTGATIASSVSVTCATLVSRGGGTGRIQLFPDGAFAAVDGRPASLCGVTTAVWRMNSVIAGRLVKAFCARKNDMVIDYEHQTQLADHNAQPAPAAGWITDLRWEDGRGLFAAVNWTDRARAYIKSGEYRYISPTFRFDRKTGEVTALVCAALTNNPALDGMEPTSAAKHGDAMSLKTLCKALGLNEDASKEDCAAAIETQGASTAVEALAAALKDSPSAAANAPVDLSAYVPMDVFRAVQQQVTTLASELSALSAASETGRLTTLVDAAIGDGRLPAASREWALGMAKSDGKNLEAMLTALAPVPALRGHQSQHTPPPADKTRVSDETLAMARLFGNTADDLKKYGTEE